MISFQIGKFFLFQQSSLRFPSLQSVGKKHGFLDWIINKLSDVISLIDEIKLGQNDHDGGTISMINQKGGPEGRSLSRFTDSLPFLKCRQGQMMCRWGCVSRWWWVWRSGRCVPRFFGRWGIRHYCEGIWHCNNYLYLYIVFHVNKIKKYWKL